MGGDYGLGDPSAMRATAARLRSHAGRLTGIATSVDGRVAATQFEGPAANVFRDGMRLRRRRVDSASRELHELARYLDGAAARVEREIAERRRQEEERRRAEEASRRQVGTRPRPR